MAGMLQAPPGTRLFDRSVARESRVINTFSGDNVDGTTNILPQMGMDKLARGYQVIMEQIYSPQNYYRRVKTLLRELMTPAINQPMNMQLFLLSGRFPAGSLGTRKFPNTGSCSSGP